MRALLIIGAMLLGESIALSHQPFKFKNDGKIATTVLVYSPVSEKWSEPMVIQPGDLASFQPDGNLPYYVRIFASDDSFAEAGWYDFVREFKYLDAPVVTWKWKAEERKVAAGEMYDKYEVVRQTVSETRTETRVVQVSEEVITLDAAGTPVKHLRTVPVTSVEDVTRSVTRPIVQSIRIRADAPLVVKRGIAELAVTDGDKTRALTADRKSEPPLVVQPTKELPPAAPRAP